MMKSSFVVDRRGRGCCCPPHDNIILSIHPDPSAPSLISILSLLFYYQSFVVRFFFFSFNAITFTYIPNKFPFFSCYLLNYHTIPSKFLLLSSTTITNILCFKLFLIHTFLNMHAINVLNFILSDQCLLLPLFLSSPIYHCIFCFHFAKKS